MYGVVCAGIIVCFYSFDLPQFRGVRMAAVVVLFLCFGAASLPLTYLLSFGFSDEMRGLQVDHPALGMLLSLQACRSRLICRQLLRAALCQKGVAAGISWVRCRSVIMAGE